MLLRLLFSSSSKLYTLQFAVVEYSSCSSSSSPITSNPYRETMTPSIECHNQPSVAAHLRTKRKAFLKNHVINVNFNPAIVFIHSRV
ncbi:hypothetical protein BDZ91DRAFT_739256 [Kalaharituber pfeilii]|nr:hypothetical protein BDZ91DRAFT_739256 [Kalaharituber pfeilii]